MRLFTLMAAAAFALVSVTAHAGEGRSLSLNGVDQKLPGALGKAAETPKVVEAPKPPDPPKPPETPKAVEAQPAAAPNAEPPAFVQRRVLRRVQEMEFPPVSRPVNAVMSWAGRVERRLGCPLPFGTSLVAVAGR